MPDRTILFHKPDEVLSQFTDTQGRRTLTDFIPIPDIYPAGRLDYHSEGLLLLSSDGALIHRLTDPRFSHPKTYLAQVEGEVDPTAIERLNQEILLPGLQTRLPRVSLIDPPDLPGRERPVRGYHPTAWLQVVLEEGKKHEVRRLTAAAGYPTLRLVRVAIGELSLEGLPAGAWRDLTGEEEHNLRRALNLLEPGGK
ncbi:MAG TPA: pseudouridine synthase [Anaerolineales bacterium]|nr:pseudouridine synthase [Anaerolineales bacterium]